MHGARVVSGKILSVTTDPGESIENVTFARGRNVFEKFSLCDCQRERRDLENWQI